MSDEISFFSWSEKFPFGTATPEDIKKKVKEGANINQIIMEKVSSRSDAPYYERSVIGSFIKAGNVKAVQFLMDKYRILPPTDEYHAEEGVFGRVEKFSLLGYQAYHENTEDKKDPRYEMVKLLLSSGADRLFDTPLEKECPSIFYGSDDGKIRNLLLEYEYPLLHLEKRINRSRSPKLLAALKKQKADAAAVKTWFENCTPYPKKEEFLNPLPDHEEPAIVTIIRTGRKNLMKAFEPLEKWTRDENRLNLREIFNVVPRTDFFIQRMMMLEDALVLENKRQHRIKAEQESNKKMQADAPAEKSVAARLTLAQKRQALSEILKSVDSPELKQKIDDSVRKRWGWKPRIKRGR